MITYYYYASRDESFFFVRRRRINSLYIINNVYFPPFFLSLSPVKKCEKCTNIIKKHHSLQNSPRFFAFPPLSPSRLPLFHIKRPSLPSLTPSRFPHQSYARHQFSFMRLTYYLIPFLIPSASLPFLFRDSRFPPPPHCPFSHPFSTPITARFAISVQKKAPARQHSLVFLSFFEKNEKKISIYSFH